LTSRALRPRVARVPAYSLALAIGGTLTDIVVGGHVTGRRWSGDIVMTLA